MEVKGALRDRGLSQQFAYFMRKDASLVWNSRRKGEIALKSDRAQPICLDNPHKDGSGSPEELAPTPPMGGWGNPPTVIAGLPPGPTRIIP